MQPTPSISHLKNYPDVYEPAEDTFLLLDTIETELDDIRSRNPLIVLEIGSGSGCVSSFIAGLLGNHCYYLCTDINPSAARATAETGLINKVSLNPIQTKFTSSLRLYKKVDVLIFNPPYVVTPSAEVGSTGIEASWAGGIDGREVIDEFLPLIQDLLSTNGVFYIVLVEENRPDEIITQMYEKYGIRCEIVGKRRSGPEKLCIVKMFFAN